MYEEDGPAFERFRARYRAFTVDEYQSIYGFTGATPKYLLGVPHSVRDSLLVEGQRPQLAGVGDEVDFDDAAARDRER
jgi:hypothetical protein